MRIRTALNNVMTGSSLPAWQKKKTHRSVGHEKSTNLNIIDYKKNLFDAQKIPVYVSVTQENNPHKKKSNNWRSWRKEKRAHTKNVLFYIIIITQIFPYIQLYISIRTYYQLHFFLWIYCMCTRIIHWHTSCHTFFVSPHQRIQRK